MFDRVFAAAGDWVVASDGLQWMLMRHIRRKRGDSWDPVSFVHSTRDVLARCMREKGVEPGTAAQLLSGLPETFDQWNQRKMNQPPRQGATDGEFEWADRPDVGAAPVGPIGLPGLAVPPGAAIGPTGSAG